MKGEASVYELYKEKYKEGVGKGCRRRSKAPVGYKASKRSVKHRPGTKR